MAVESAVTVVQDVAGYRPAIRAIEKNIFSCVISHCSKKVPSRFSGRPSSGAPFVEPIVRRHPVLPDWLSKASTVLTLPRLAMAFKVTERSAKQVFVEKNFWATGIESSKNLKKVRQ